MGIQIVINVEPGMTLLDHLQSAGLLPDNISFGAALLASTAQPVIEGTATDAGPAAPPAASAPRRARRTKAEMEAAAAAEAAGTAPPASAGPAAPSGVVFQTRRYGGEIDHEFTTSADAASRLIDLIRTAGDGQAQIALERANEGLIENLTDEDADRIAAAFDTAHASLTGTKPDAAPLLDDGWPLGMDQKPLRVVTLDRKGALDTIMAIATGPDEKVGGKFGMAVGLQLLQGFNVNKVSEIKDDADPRLAQIAAAAAKLLGLPTQGAVNPTAASLV